jgi:hypothetical protein
VTIGREHDVNLAQIAFQMSARFLIEHTRSVLTLQESYRLGLAEKSKTAHDEDILAQYLAENDIKSPNERLFITETFLGCHRQRRLIEATLKMFFRDTGSRYFQKDFNLFAGVGI